MGNNDLRIEISAGLNPGKSIKDINNQIKGLEKHPSLRRIRIKMDIDPKVLRTLERFNTQMQSMNRELMGSFTEMKKVTETAITPDGVQVTREHYEGLGKTFSETVKEADKLTNSMERSTGRKLKLNKETQNFNKGLDLSKARMVKNTQATNEQARATRRLTDEAERLHKRVTNRNKKGSITGTTETFRDGYVDTIVNTNKKGESSTRIVDNINKEREATRRLAQSKDELRQKHQELIQMGQLSSRQSLQMQRMIETSSNQDHIKKATDEQRHLLKISKEQLQVEQAKHNVAKKKEQEIRKDKEHNRVLQQQLDLFKRKQALQVQDLRHRYGSAIDNNALNAHMGNVNALGVSKDTPHIMRQTAQGLKQIEMNAKLAGGAIGHAHNHSVGLVDAFKTAMVKFPIWMAASTAFFGTVRGLRDITSQIIEIDTQMTTLRRVSGGEIDTGHILRESVDLADRLGNQIREINSGLELFARQGFRGEGLIAMTEASTLFSNISEMDVEEAASGLTSIINGFQMLPEEVMTAVDAVNEVDNNFAISSANIVKSMSKSVGSAQTFGVELNELIGMSVAIGETTRESGNIIGNSLKTIFSRIPTMSGSIEALNSVGVAVSDMEGNVRPVARILDDLAGKWDTLNASQQQSIGLQIAGRFQLSRFLVLMQNYETALEATDTAMNSAGSGMRENEQYLQSLEARINKLRNAWTEFALGAGDAFLTDGIIAFSEGMASLIQSGSGLVRTIGFLPPLIGMVTFAIMAMNNSMRTSIVTATQKQGALATLSGIIRGVGASATATGAAFLTMGRFMIGAFPPLAIITGVTFAMERLFSVVLETSRAKEELNQKLSESANSLEENSEQVDDLASRYKELENVRNSDGLNLDQEEEYVKIQNELAQLLPSVVTGMDSKGNKIIVNSQLLEREIELLERKIELERQERLMEAPEKLDDLKNEKERLETRKAGQRVALETLEAQREEVILAQENATNDTERVLAKQEEERLDRDILKFRSEQLEFDNQILSKQFQIEQVYRDILHSAENLSDQDFEFLQGLDKHILGIKNIGEEISKIREITGDMFTADEIMGLDDHVSGVLDAMSHSFKNGYKDWEQWRGALEEAGLNADKIISHIINKTNEQAEAQSKLQDAVSDGVLFLDPDGLNPVSPDMLADLDEAQELFIKVEDRIISYTDYMIGATDATDNHTESLWDNISATEALFGVTSQQISAIENAIEVYTILSQVENLNEDQSYQLQQAKAFLASIFPHLVNGTEINIEAMKTESEVMQGMGKLSGDYANGRMSNEDSLTFATVSAVNQRIRAYQNELAQLDRAKQAAVSMLNDIDRVANATGHHDFMAEHNALVQWQNAATQIPKLQESIASATAERNKLWYGSNLPSLAGFSSGGSSGRGSSSPSRTSSGSSKSPAEILADRQREAWERAQQSLQKYVRALDLLDHQLSMERLAREHMTEGSREYSQSINREINLISKRQKEISSYISAMNTVIKQDKISKDHKYQLTQEIRKQQQELKQLDNQIQSHINTQRQYLADESIRILQSAMQKRIELLQKERDAELRMLDERTKAHSDYIDAKLRDLDREEKENDFRQSEQELMNKQIELQRQIDIISLDNSQQANARKRQLEEEYTNTSNQLAEMREKRTNELRRQGLQDEKQRVQEETENKKSALQEEYDERAYLLEEQLKDEAHFAQLREEIMSGNMNNIQNLINGYLKDFKSYNEDVIKDLGSSWQELINLINSANQLSKDVNNASKGVTNNKPKPSPSPSGSKSGSGGNNGSSGSDSASTSGLPLRKGTFATPRGGWDSASVVDYIKQRGYHADFPDRDKLYKHLKGSGVYAGTSQQNTWLLSQLKKLPHFEKGGNLGSWSGNKGKPFIGHSDEHVLAAKPTENLYKTMKLFNSHILPVVNQLKNYQIKKPNANIGGGGNTYNINIDNIHGVDRQTATSFGKAVIDTIKRNGG